MQAFLLWMRPTHHEAGGLPRLPIALLESRLIIGWAYADLIDTEATQDAFRSAMFAGYAEISGQKAGSWASIVLNFFHGVSLLDLVVVPDNDTIHIARVTSEVQEVTERQMSDMRYYRRCDWLNSVPRSTCSATLNKQLSDRKTCVSLGDSANEVAALARLA